MKHARHEAISSHRDFSPAYPDLVTKFADTQQVTIGPMDYREAISTRNQFYRYVRWLCRAPPDDLEALTLREIAQTMKCRITETDGGYILDWHESPIAEWARMHGAQLPLYKRKPP